MIKRIISTLLLLSVMLSTITTNAEEEKKVLNQTRTRG